MVDTAAMAPALPAMYAGGQEFSQALAVYNNSQLFTDPGLVEPPIMPLDQIRMATFDQTMASMQSNAGDVFSAGVRYRFLKAFGIGYQSINPNVAHNPLAFRAMSAVADISKDMGSYLYSGKSFGAKPTDATKAMKWFVPVTMTGKNGMATPASKAGRRMQRLGRASVAGFRSFLGWNFILGNPEDMTAGDMTMSLLKNVAVSYGIDAIASRFLRRPGAIINHLSTIFKDDAIEKLFNKETGLISKEVVGKFSDPLKNMLKRYQIGKDIPASKRAQLAKAIRRKAGKEMDRLALKNPAVYAEAWGNARSVFNEASTATRAIVSDGISKIPGGRRGLSGMTSFVNELSDYKDPLRGKGFFTSLKETAVDTARWVGRRPNASFDNARNSFTTLASRTMRNTWTVGGMALRLANVASGALAVAGVARDIAKYRDNVRTEYIRNLTSDRMSFTMLPEFGMTGTERTRAVEAIQNSGMNARNYLGQEAAMFH